ncbi:acetolactate synthase, large subunit, biosynthetic type [Enterococcus florum]|uniref:Acetolactate synthase n=1 Tax=Enterococcus florum TaxID=2480627 RepID=A0A4P5PIK3_9ENTE|nr:biosynthetic-type acetolactate synthase large subunit [Enterococcus florum]GCF93193.1 acetolactate synthase, large subunit, biosynthetic type [Enterococcus florum]
MISGAELVVKALIEEEVEVCFAYPGGQAIDLFDALYERKEFRVILPRHEQGLIHAADGYARSTGKVGVCMVTSGPGATNLITGIATAAYDASPLVCFTGQVATHLIGKDAFQEVDMVGISRSVAKYAVTVKRREELGTVIKKAFTIAQTGKPGVVVVDIPKNIQQQLGTEAYPKTVAIRGYHPQTTTSGEKIKQAIEWLNQAQTPVLLVGGGVHRGKAYQQLCKLAEDYGLPVVTTIMGKGALPSDHACYIGNAGIHGSFSANQALVTCDLLFAIGTRLNDRVTGNSTSFCSSAKVIHLDIDPAAIGKNIETDLSLVGDVGCILAQINQESPAKTHKKWTKTLKQAALDQPIHMPESGLTPEAILSAINQLFSSAIVVTDVGQNQLWTTQFLQVNQERELLTSGGLGTMGYGFPAALGAKVGNPEKDVLVITGDGGFQMNLQELATAVIEKIPVIICIFNNGCLGNVRQWQEMFYDKRYSFTDLLSDERSYVPDFIALAHSYGVEAVRVVEEKQIEVALRQAKKSVERPFLIEFILESQQKVLPIVPPGQSLEEMILYGE